MAWTEPRNDLPPLTLVIAPTFERFRTWCQENDVNPRNPRVVSVVDRSDVHRMRGRMKRDGDRIVNLGFPQSWTLQDIFDFQNALAPCGFELDLFDA